MKRFFLWLLVVLLCLVCAGALAGPAVTDGQTTGWIAENGAVMLQDANGLLRQIPAAAVDLPSITEDYLLCVTRAGLRLTISRDGTQIRTAAENLPEAASEARLRFENGVLSLDGSLLSPAVSVFTQDSAFVYYIERDGETRTLRVRSMLDEDTEPVPDSRSARALALDGRSVADPRSLTITRDALTLTGADQQVTVFDLRSGGTLEFPAPETPLDAACMMNDVLYRYTFAEDTLWTLVSSEKIPAADPTAVTTLPAAPTETPTATPTATPSPTPRPTATPTPRPTATPADLIDEDGTIHKGASGDVVKKIQRRLAELGYPVGSADGKYGDKTQLAINLFCDAIHVREHNYITASVQKKLFASSAPEYDPYLPLQKGDRGVSVLYMQRRLNELGYDPGKLDGIYGAMTVTALTQFQEDFQIKLGSGEKPGEYASHELLEILFAPESEMVPAKK